MKQALIDRQSLETESDFFRTPRRICAWDLHVRERDLPGDGGRAPSAVTFRPTATSPFRRAGRPAMNVVLLLGSLLGLGGAAAALAWWRGRGRQTDMGSVSYQWINEHRLSQPPDRQR